MNNTYHFVRHAPTSHNEDRIFMGTLDTPLSRAGVDAAMKLHETCRRMEIDLAFSSPLMRAFHTAVIALGMARPEPSHESSGGTLSYLTGGAMIHRVPIIVDPRLTERSFGDLQGHPQDEYTKRFPQYQDRQITRSFGDNPAGGESFGDLRDRLTGFIAELKAHRNKTIMVFSHNGPLRVIRQIFEALSDEETLKLENPHCEMMTYAD